MMKELIISTPSYIIGIVGNDPRAARLTELLLGEDFSTTFPWVKLAEIDNSMADPSSQDEVSPQQLIATHPNIDLLFDLRANGRPPEDLRAELPASVTLAGESTADFLLEILASGLACTSCLSDLFHTRNLFTTIFDEVEEDVILLDTQGRILDVNTNVYERRGRPKEEFIGIHCWELEGREFCCEDEERGKACPYKATLKEGKKAESVHSYVDRDGRMRYFRIYTYPIFNNDKRLTHIMEMRRDITVRTSMEMRLQQSEKMAIIGELSTYIAHEIRNPLFAIGGFANSLLRSTTLSETDREKVSIILKESKRLDTILKSTINFSRPVDAKKGLVDVNMVAAETMRLLTFGAEQKSIVPVLQTDPSIAKAVGDSDLVKQCLINMVKNSMEAMPDGGSLFVRTGMRDGHIFLEVEDTGHGIPEEIRTKVFNPFFSTKDKGAGLGLAMTKKIIEDMGGRVELYSQADEGTSVTLFFSPALAVDAETSLLAQENPEEL